MKNLQKVEVLQKLEDFFLFLFNFECVQNRIIYDDRLDHH